MRIALKSLRTDNMAEGYRTAPLNTESTPPGIPYIVANEAAERFSYYGMRAILVVFMTQYMLDAAGNPDYMSKDEAKAFFHLFVAASYITPFLGALLADIAWGKFKVILSLSLVYCLGHFALALDETYQGLLIGQTLIALGAGGIKPCVSSHMGDQFTHSNQQLINKAYGWFYLAINTGAFTSMLFIPWVLDQYGAGLAFGIPGLLMLIATVTFWSGRYKFAHIPPAGKSLVRELFSLQSWKLLGRLSIIYAFIAMFWALFDQTGSSWVLQAEQMDRNVLGYEILPSQIQAANPLLVIALIPLFSRFIYPTIERFIRLTPLRKISFGLFLTAIAFSIPSLIQAGLDQGDRPSILWQLVAYLLLTASEVMVSITCLEFSYTQAPLKMKSFVMAFFMLSVAAGNLFTSLVNLLIQNPDGSSKLDGANYFWFFTALMLITAVLFIPIARRYKYNTQLQASSS